MLFHFTRFESAVKILATNYLLFGDFVNMNDISEVRREIFSDYLEKEIQLYKSLSFTIDKKSQELLLLTHYGGIMQKKGMEYVLRLTKRYYLTSSKSYQVLKEEGKFII